MTPPKVALLSSVYAPEVVGGAERVVQTIAEGLASDGFEPVVITLNPTQTASVDVLNGVTVHRIAMPNIYWPFAQESHGFAHRAIWHARDAYNRRAGRAVAEILDAEAPDIVNTHNIAGFSVSVWNAAVTAGVPLVHTVHDQYLLCPRTTMFRDGENCEAQCGSCRLFTAPGTHVSGHPQVVTGPSQFILDRHVEHGWFRDTTRRVVRNAQVANSGDVTRESGDGEDPLRFGFLGRLAETKGLDRLLQAFVDLPEGSAELVIGGTGEPGYERSLRRIAGDRGDIHWLGFIDPATLLDQIDVLVVPSTWDDTAPLVVLEAFAHQRPVIGANRGGIPELVALGDGWIVDPDDRAGFTARLLDCIERRGQLAELGHRCRDASLELTIEGMLDGYRDAYRASGTRGF